MRDLPQKIEIVVSLKWGNEWPILGNLDHLLLREYGPFWVLAFHSLRALEGLLCDQEFILIESVSRHSHGVLIKVIQVLRDEGSLLHTKEANVNVPGLRSLLKFRFFDRRKLLSLIN